MMTEELITCPACGYERALTHWSSGNEVNWTACPKCRKFFDHDKEVEEKSEYFWQCVDEDTGYKGGGKN